MTVSVMALGAALGTTTLAHADAARHTKIDVTVTIKALGTDLSGRVKTPDPATCALGRTVWVWRQIGTRGGGDDVRMFSDTVDQQGDRYVWSTGNTGHPGYFYARLPGTPACHADTSPTVHAIQNTS
jgi:hypothetical protein